ARIALLPSRTGPGTGRPPDADEVSRFSRVQFLDVRTALGLRRAWRKLAMSFPSVWPSRCMHSVGARYSFFEARFLARRCLCLHFTRHLTAPSAKLEVKMVRYSFLVGLFHPRLHAGFIPTLAHAYAWRFGNRAFISTMCSLALFPLLVVACAFAQPKIDPQKEAGMKADVSGQI